MNSKHTLRMLDARPNIRLTPPVERFEEPLREHPVMVQESNGWLALTIIVLVTLSLAALPWVLLLMEWSRP